MIATGPRVLMIGLDGLDPVLAGRMMGEGRLPALRRIAAEGATVPLDHGAAKRTGLAWEHVATGLAPEAAGRWGAVDFDPDRYTVVQSLVRHPPFAAALGLPAAIFDAPYFDLSAAPCAQGMVGWGAHDPGVDPTARPAGLAKEIEARFGAYPASRWIYGFTWPSPERTRAAAEALVLAVERRGDIAEWLLAERLPDWRLGFVVVSEYHSAIEPFWHGVDPAHPLHGLPSAEPSRRGVEAVYEAGDRLIARLATRFPDARLVLFNLHGMGPNHSDVASMALLPELLYRRRFGRPRLRARRWPATEAGVPLIGEQESWEGAMSALLRPRLGLPWRLRSFAGRAAERALRRRGGDEISMGWMPAAQYRRFWPKMDAFAFPSFYDGRVRINLEGRERDGRVPPGQYESVRAEIERLVSECRDPLTGAAAAARFERADGPEAVSASGADLTVLWNGSPLGLVHPELGTIGPLPYRRTGGHSGGHGAAWFAGPGIDPATLDVRSAFDVAPTVVELLGRPVPRWMSGRSLAGELVPPQAAAAE